MPWPKPPYPPGFQPPGIGYFLLVGGITLCFIGLVLYLALTAPAAIRTADEAGSPKDEDKSDEDKSNDDKSEQRVIKSCPARTYGMN